MKILLGLVAMLGLAGVVQADTLALDQTVGFGATHEYLNVGNASGLAIDIVIGGTAGVNIGGDLFTGPYFGSGVPFVVTDSEGTQVTVFLLEKSTRKCTGSGRGQTCHNVYTLLDGSYLQD